MSPVNYPYELKLKHPIQFGSEEIKIINYRRPRAKDMRGINMNNLDFGSVLDIFAKMSDQPPPAIDEMDAEDAIKAVEVFSSFLGVGQ